MQQFKVGDWVKTKAGYIKQISCITDDKCDTLSIGSPSVGINVVFKNEIELWQPKQGEWCWFWNNEKDLILQKFWKKQQDYFIVVFSEKHKTDGLIFYDVTDKHFKNCEPFIGQLPTFLKEQ